MRASSFIDPCFAKLNQISVSTTFFRLFSYVNSAACCFDVPGDEPCIFDGLANYNQELLASIIDNEKADCVESESINLPSSHCGLDRSCRKGYGFQMSQWTLLRISRLLFYHTSDAEISLHLSVWSENCFQSKHHMTPICKMIHLLVSGNMNHRAVDLVFYLIRKTGGEEGSHTRLVETFVQTHRERRVLEVVCSMLVNCYVKEDMANVALGVSMKIKQLNLFPSIKVCNSLLKALLWSKQSDLAWDFLEEMRGQDMEINATIISLFVNDFCLRGDIRSGWNFLTETRKLGIEADKVSYTIVIHNLCRMSCLREATSLLFKLLQLGYSLDPVMMSSVIDGYCKVGRLDKAMHILKSCKVPSNIFVYSSFMTRFCGDGDMSSASELYYDMLKVGLFPDCYIYTTMIQGYGRTKDIYRALVYYGKMLKTGILPSATTYAVLVHAFCKVEDVQMAGHAIQVMTTDGFTPDVVTYNTVLHGYGKNGSLHEVFELLGLMTFANVSPDIISYNTIINILVTRGFLSEAKDIVDELILRGFSPDVATFTIIIHGCSRRNEFGDAFRFWMEMSKRNVQPDVVTCSALINGYCKARRVEEANALFKKMLDGGLKPDIILYNTLIRGFCSIGYLTDAYNLVNMMVKNKIFPNHITHKALILGFEKKRATNPEDSAASKLQEILMRQGQEMYRYQ